MFTLTHTQVVCFAIFNLFSHVFYWNTFSALIPSFFLFFVFSCKLFFLTTKSLQTRKYKKRVVVVGIPSITYICFWLCLHIELWYYLVPGFLLYGKIFLFNVTIFSCVRLKYWLSRKENKKKNLLILFLFIFHTWLPACCMFIDIIRPWVFFYSTHFYYSKKKGFSW